MPQKIDISGGGYLTLTVRSCLRYPALTSSFRSSEGFSGIDVGTPIDCVELPSGNVIVGSMKQIHFSHLLYKPWFTKMTTCRHQTIIKRRVAHPFREAFYVLNKDGALYLLSDPNRTWGFVGAPKEDAVNIPKDYLVIDICACANGTVYALLTLPLGADRLQMVQVYSIEDTALIPIGDSERGVADISRLHVGIERCYIGQGNGVTGFDNEKYYWRPSRREGINIIYELCMRTKADMVVLLGKKVIVAEEAFPFIGISARGDLYIQIPREGIWRWAGISDTWEMIYKEEDRNLIVHCSMEKKCLYVILSDRSIQRVPLLSSEIRVTVAGIFEQTKKYRLCLAASTRCIYAARAQRGVLAFMLSDRLEVLDLQQDGNVYNTSVKRGVITFANTRFTLSAQQYHVVLVFLKSGAQVACKYFVWAETGRTDYYPFLEATMPVTVTAMLSGRNKVLKTLLLPLEKGQAAQLNKLAQQGGQVPISLLSKCLFLIEKEGIYMVDSGKCYLIILSGDTTPTVNMDLRDHGKFLVYTTSDGVITRISIAELTEKLRHAISLYESYDHYQPFYSKKLKDVDLARVKKHDDQTL